MRAAHWFVAIVALLTISCRRERKELASGEVPSTRDERVRRGEYLAYVGGCNDCHSPGGMYGAPDGARRLSGSDLGWRGPWGTSYPPNLTPDVETGIGSWSERDIVNTIRTGKRPDGRPLLPPMPWPNFAHLTDDDAMALATYLKSLPPIKHRSPPALPPGDEAQASVIIPPPPAWDAPRATSVGGGPPPP